MAKKRPGKYDHVIPKLPKWVDTSPYQERVEAMKVEIMKCQHCKRDDVPAVPDCEHCKTGGACYRCNGSGKRKLNAEQLGAEYVIARAMKEDLEAQAAAASVVVKALSQMLVFSQEQKEQEWGAFGASDNALRLTNGDGLRAQPEIYPSKSNKAQFRQWCFDNGLRDKMELPDKELEKLAKERLLNGLPDAPGTTIYVDTKIVYSPLKTEVAEPQTHDAEVF